MYAALGVKFIGRGYDNVPAEGPAVICSNHVSYLDFIFVGSPPWWRHRRLTRFMAKDGVFHHAVSGPLMRGMHHIPVDREAGAASLQSATDALNRGELVGMFPEATISQSFTVKELKTGAARMARDAGAPLIPMATWGTQRFWTKNQDRRFPRNQTVCLLVGEPMDVPADADVVDVTADLKIRIQALLDEAQAIHPDTARVADFADPWWLPHHLGGSAPTPEVAAAADAAERAERAARRKARAAAEQKSR